MFSLPLLILLINLAATWFLTGLIWFVQVVHYPQFCDVGADAFGAYHRRHTRLTTRVVAGPMLVEAATAVALLWWGGGVLPAAMAWAGVGLVAVVWLSTAFVQVPRHHRLSTGYAADVGRALCSTNWIRTAAWSARAVIMLWAVGRLLAGNVVAAGPS